MKALITALSLVLVAAEKPGLPPEADSAADGVTLRDGRILLGQIQDNPPRAPLTMIVRRAWAAKALPDLFKRWEAEEAPITRRADTQRKTRLEAWRRERGTGKDANDPIDAWITRELARLADPNAAKPPLMLLNINRGSARAIARRPPKSARALRLAWQLGFDDAESMTLDRLKDGLDGRGLSADGTEPVSVESLLPTPTESDAQWRVRRAATEVAYDSGLRFLRTQAFVVAEPAAGQQPNLDDALSALRGLKRLLDDDQTDPLAEKLDQVARRGRVGAVVTQQATSPDLSAATVEMTLWVRNPANRWVPLGARTATIRTEQVQDNDAKNLGDDPQLAQVFQLFEGLGFGVPPDIKEKGLKIGAAVQRALGIVRSAFQEDINRFALPIGAAAPEAEKAKAKGHENP
jgi:hypothetical protein